MNIPAKSRLAVRRANKRDSEFKLYEVKKPVT
jgi:hypothetical protein